MEKENKKGKAQLTAKEAIVYLFEYFERDCQKVSTEIYVKSSTGILGNKRRTECENMIYRHPDKVKKFLEDRKVDLDSYSVMGIDGDFPDEIRKMNERQFYFHNFNLIQLVVLKNIA